jgi:hypothetical protein
MGQDPGIFPPGRPLGTRGGFRASACVRTLEIFPCGAPQGPSLGLCMRQDLGNIPLRRRRQGQTLMSLRGSWHPANLPLRNWGPSPGLCTSRDLGNFLLRRPRQEQGPSALHRSGPCKLPLAAPHPPGGGLPALGVRTRNNATRRSLSTPWGQDTFRALKLGQGTTRLQVVRDLWDNGFCAQAPQQSAKIVRLLQAPSKLSESPKGLVYTG